MSSNYVSGKEFKELGRFIDRCYGRTRTCSSVSNKETTDDSANSVKVTCFFVSTNSAQNVYPDNGWRPMSIEKVLELQKDFIKTPNVHFEFENSPKPPTSVMDDFENKKFVKIIQTNEITKKPTENNEVVLSEQDRNEYQELIKIIHPPRKEIITLDDTNTLFNHEKQNQRLRKAKKINNSNIVLLLNSPRITDQRKSDEKRAKENELNEEIDSTKNYEVKEKLEEDTQAAPAHNLFYPKEFKHQIPKSAKADTKNNLTASLLEILANYNIRTSDNLRNYDISLRQNSRNSYNPDFAFASVPLKVPIRYNNPNHLLVDPLLAVFLSNYGHYLPSLFGIHGGYNNLYGYLASNNIHNNKPFGAYKIFSDTDSFH
ncbi:uncharacterized protein LOC123868843 [Maniola jurtina]|uniref:uncharacterized protein LOC123868843 n=1 Tax=Maniola jurtina TaxID=191418 RepID=UPI001E686944|nr:uncharacterized protein LOC123868843 [Maniola jurtina]